MKNILSENLIRFGAKNLTESQKQQLLAEGGIKDGPWIKLEKGSYSQPSSFLYSKYRYGKKTMNQDYIDYGIPVGRVTVDQVDPSYKIPDMGSRTEPIPAQNNINLNYTAQSYDRYLKPLYAGADRLTMTIKNIKISPDSDFRDLFANTDIQVNQTIKIGDKINFTISMKTPPAAVSLKYDPTAKRSLPLRNDDGTPKMQWPEPYFGRADVYGSINAPKTSLEDYYDRIDYMIKNKKLPKDDPAYKDGGKARKAQIAQEYPNGTGGEPTPFRFEIRIEGQKGKNTQTAIGRPIESRAQQRKN